MRFNSITLWNDKTLVMVSWAAGSTSDIDL